MTTYPTFAATNRSNLRIIPEANGQWGQTPTTGTTRELLVTSHTMSTKKNTTKSNQIRDDRMVSDIIETEMMSDGSLHFEFQAGGMDDLLQGFVQGTWTRPMTMDFWAGTAVSWASSSTVTIVGLGDLTGYFTVGRRMKTDGFVSPVNNGFFQVSSVAYAAPTFTVTFATSTGVAEGGNIHSIIADANDVIVLKNTAIRAGTAGAPAFDSNTTNAFSSAITAGQLVSGQKIHVDGLGYGVGTFTFSAVAVALDSVTVNDGVNAYTFVAGADFAVGTTATTTATNLTLAINQARVFGVGGSPGVAPTFLRVNAVSAVGVVTVTNLNGVGGSLAKIVDSTTVDTVVTFAGGVNSEHGIFTIVSAANDVLTVTPAPATNANAGSLPVTIRGSMLRNPSASVNIIPQSYSIESFYQDVGHGFKQDGMMPSAFTLDANASAVMTASVDFMGRATTTLNSTLLGASPYVVLNPVTTEIMNATTDVGQILKNGVALSTAVKQIKLDGKAQLRNQMAVSSKFPVGIGTGRMEITGTASVYFADLQMFNNFLNHDTVSLAWNFFDSQLRTYYFTIPALKFTADPVNVRGIDADIMEDLVWEAFRDPITQCQIQLDRFSSLLPVLG
jgi:hypothetical protein